MEKALSNNNSNFYNNNAKSRISFGKINRAAKAELRVHSKLFIISMVLYGTAFVLFAAFTKFVRLGDGVASSVGASKRIIGFEPSIWGISFTVVGVITNFFAALNIFRDMNSKQLCDVAMSLPIKASERYLSKLLALFYMQTAPLIISVFGGTGLNFLFSLPGSEGVNGEVIISFLMFVVPYLTSALFVGAVTVLTACCCGEIAESAYFSVIFMGIVNILPVSVMFHMVLKNSGFVISRNMFSSIFYFSEWGAVDVGWWGFLSFGYSAMEDILLHSFVNIIISLTVLFLTWFIFRKRDARSVGIPISGRVYFETVMFLGCFTVFSVFVMTGFALWGILVCAVIYTVINIIVSRAKLSLKSVLIWAGKFVGTTAAFAVMFAVCVKTGGFGQIDLRPETKYLADANFRITSYGLNNFEQDYRRDSVRYYTTRALSASEADEVLSVCRDYMKKSAAKTSVLDALTGRNSGDDHKKYGYVWVELVCDSKLIYAECPSPRVLFRREYVTEQIGSAVRGYSLNFGQGVYMPYDVAKEMIKALDGFGCMESSNTYLNLA